MKRTFETVRKVNKQAEYLRELQKLSDIFKDVEESKRKLVEGLIQDTAYLYAENQVLKETLNITGMVRINPDNPSQQKPIEAAKQFRQNVASYSVNIKVLNGILSKNIIEEDDGMDEFE